ncbi:MAG: hypothetical protein PSV35_03925 [bacterium]|nr:hypothetical protein [bacterium]
MGVFAVPLLKNNKDGIQRAFERYERYLVIKELAGNKITMPIPESLIQRLGSFNLGRDKIHIQQIASEFNKRPQELIQQIESAQKIRNQKTFTRLKKEHPILADYEILLKERSKVSGFRAEQVDKLLLVKGRELIKDSVLYKQLQDELPKFTQSLLVAIKSHDLNRSRGR